MTEQSILLSQLAVAENLGDDEAGSIPTAELRELVARCESLERERDESREKNRKLRAEMTAVQGKAAERNAQMDALGRVWCDGGCAGGMHRYTDEPVTAEQVAFLIRNAVRARTWFVNRAGKDSSLNEEYQAKWEGARVQILDELTAQYEDEIEKLRAALDSQEVPKI